jgi:hypothetical protein
LVVVITATYSITARRHDDPALWLDCDSMKHTPYRIPREKEFAGEVAYYRGLSDAERADLLVAACRAGAKILLSRPDAERIAGYQDPLPQSTVRALARLRAAYRAARSAPKR